MKDERYIGTVLIWKGTFGFLFSEETGRRYFHAREWNATIAPVTDQKVRFSLGRSKKPGMPDEAINVIPVHPGADALKTGTPAPQSNNEVRP